MEESRVVSTNFYGDYLLNIETDTGITTSSFGLYMKHVEWYWLLLFALTLSAIGMLTILCCVKLRRYDKVMKGQFYFDLKLNQDQPAALKLATVHPIPSWDCVSYHKGNLV